jgi:hypothetical protein
MNRRSAVAALASFAAAPVLAHPHDEPKSAMDLAVEKVIHDVREAIRLAVAARDVAALKAIYAPAYTHTHSSGKVDGRDARIVSLLAGEPAIETAPAEDLHIDVYGTQTAIVTGRSPILNRTENRTSDFRWIQVYVNAGTGWRLAASQATRLPPPTH